MHPIVQTWYQRLYSQYTHRKSIVSTVTILLLIPILIACPGGGTDPPENRAPSVTLNVTPAQGTAPLSVEATATATDPDDDALSFSWQVNGETVTGDGNTLNTTLEPAGSYTIRVTVSDGSAEASAQEIVNVTTEGDDNRAPTVTLAVTPDSGEAPLNVQATATASDLDGDTLSFSWQVNGEAVTGSDSTLSTTLEPAGNYTIRVTVSDGSLQASAQQVVTVTEAAANDTVVGGFVSEQSRNVIVILTDENDTEEAHTVPKMNVDDINQAASKLLGHSLSTQQANEPVIKGINALVMHSIFSQQQEGGETLFNFEGKEVVAATASGEVLSSGTIGTDGAFNVPLTAADKQEAVAFFVAEQNEDGSWTCLEQLEYGVGAITEPAIIDLSDSDAANLTLGSAFIPATNSNDLVAGVSSAPSDVRVGFDTNAAEPFRDGVYRACANPDWREVEVTAQFFWDGEIFSGAVDLDNDGFIDFAGFEEAILYDSSVAFGLFVPDMVDTTQDVTTALDNAIGFLDTLEASEIRGIGPIAPDGSMIMEVVKNESEDVELSLTLLDLGLIDPALSPQPYTPIFDLNDALRFTDPTTYGENTIVGDNGFAYGPLGGGMAYRAGAAAYRDPATGELLPATGAFVVIALQRNDILAFNYAFVDADGFYQILIPSIGIGADGTTPPYFFGVFDFSRNLGDFATTNLFDPTDPNYLVNTNDARIENFLLELPLN
ncbi:MAG: PKD domain-containing protein [Deinococcota bacterium]